MRKINCIPKFISQFIDPDVGFLLSHQTEAAHKFGFSSHFIDKIKNPLRIKVKSKLVFN